MIWSLGDDMGQKESTDDGSRLVRICGTTGVLDV